MPEKKQCTVPVRAELRGHPATGVEWGGCRVPGAWKADPAHCSEMQSLDLTLLQMMAGSLAWQLEGEVQSVWRGSTGAGKGDISKKQCDIQPET